MIRADTAKRLSDQAPDFQSIGPGLDGPLQAAARRGQYDLEYRLHFPEDVAQADVLVSRLRALGYTVTSLDEELYVGVERHNPDGPGVVHTVEPRQGKVLHISWE